jgi:hypothetical protein
MYGTMRFEIVCIKIRPAVRPGPRLKKKRLRYPTCYISPIWGEAASEPIVTQLGAWGPLPDIINRNKFHLNQSSSLRALGSENLARSMEWPVILTTARALSCPAVIIGRNSRKHCPILIILALLCLSIYRTLAWPKSDRCVCAAVRHKQFSALQVLSWGE